MKIHSFEFVKECAHDAILEAIQGTITFIGDRKEGTGDRGPYSFQTIALTAPNGAKLDVKLVNREPVPLAWKGKTVQINSTINSKNNRTGLYALTEEYQNKQYFKAKATGSAEMIDLANASTGTQLREAVEQNLSQQQASPQQASHTTTSQPAAQRQAPQAQSAPAATSAQKSELQRIRERIAKYAGLQSICYDAAVHVAHGIYERHGIAIMPGSVGIMGDKIFIEVARKTDIDLLPMDPYAEKPFRGRPLDELIPAMRQQIGEGKAEMEFASAEKRQEIGQQAMAAAAAATSAPTPEPTPDAEPEHEEDVVPF